MPTLDQKLRRISTRNINKTINNAVDRASSLIPNIVSGLDIADNGLVKGLITDTIGDIIKSGLIKSSPKMINLAGPSYSQASQYAKNTTQFVKLNTVKEVHKTKGDKKSLEFTTDKKILESTILPFPQTIGITTSPKWDSESGGAIGEILLNQGNNLNSNKGMMDKIYGAVDIGANVKKAALGTVGQLVTGQDNLNKIVDASNKKLMNPRDVALFSGIDHRTFSLMFNFGVQSKEEAAALSNYIKSLHKSALPSLNGVYFDYPEYFTFAIVDGNNKTILDRGEVVINNIECNYTPEGIWATFKDGTPIHVELTLGFMERKLPTRETIDKTFGK